MEDCLAPILVSMSDSGARNQIAQVGGRVGTVTMEASSSPVDSVISQSVEADGVTIDLVESNGNTTVPNVLGNQEDYAISRIQGLGLVVGTDTHVNDCVDPGDVEMQDPIGVPAPSAVSRSTSGSPPAPGGGIPK